MIMLILAISYAVRIIDSLTSPKLLVLCKKGWDSESVNWAFISFMSTIFSRSTSEFLCTPFDLRGDPGKDDALSTPFCRIGDPGNDDNLMPWTFEFLDFNLYLFS
ncbi:hypothetical protein KC19_5G126100 [Ceratodon purpureus]|uniref:Uncharacterized protein n=1 Tax=Ceratodon purpureus TaxID=3225 RepID=A0A8T0I251_CERPU|nr:hypothetical protein KC19_5G126100 [Ceratodon purpureus]